jgi:elongator complex protein 6
VSTPKTTHTLLILDTPSLLLHTTTPPITSTALSTLFLTLRNLPTVHSAIVSIPADGPFLAPAASLATAHFHGQRYVPNGRGAGASLEGGGHEALESENAAFTVGAVQAARCVVQCRALGTGWAEDVSGVVRVTRGGCCDGEETDTDDTGEPVQEGEWLYYIGGDGGVKVWGRGDSGR